MGLVLTVGPPEAVLDGGLAPGVRARLGERFGEGLALGAPAEATGDGGSHVSTEMGWGWWGELQALARETLGAGGAAHLGAVEAWRGVFLPWEVAPCELVLERSRWAWLQRLLFGQANPAALAAFPPGNSAWTKLRLATFRAITGRTAVSDSTLQVAGLPGLVAELEALGVKLALPVDDAGLEVFLEGYAGDRCDDDPALQAYALTLRAAHEACARDRPLWVVK